MTQTLLDLRNFTNSDRETLAVKRSKECAGLYLMRETQRGEQIAA